MAGLRIGVGGGGVRGQRPYTQGLDHGLRFRVRGGRPEIKGHIKNWTAGLRFRAGGGRARGEEGRKGLMRTPGVAELERPCQE